jgi:hypothetical protein
MFAGSFARVFILCETLGPMVSQARWPVKVGYN